MGKFKIKPMITAEYSSVFIFQVNSSFSQQLKETMDQAAAAGDDDLSSVDIGAIFLDALPMLEAFQAYCTKQVGTYY